MLSQTIRNALILLVPFALLAGLFPSGMKEFLDADSGPGGATTQQPTDSYANSVAGGRVIELRAGPNGHFLAEALVNGERIVFVVDTGASEVALRMEDARKLGFERDRLEFNRRYQTANGVARGARITLDEVSIGQLSVYGVQASVLDAPLGVSLLGLSFLNRLDGYEVRNNRLVLHW